jgi:phosphatidate phosphatase APP1
VPIATRIEVNPVAKINAILGNDVPVTGRRHGVRRVVRAVLRRPATGRPAVILPYVGYVGQSGVGSVARVRARVLRRSVVPTEGPVRAWRTLIETVAWFVTAEVPHLPVEATSDVETVHAATDNEGYVDVRVRVDKPTENHVTVRMSARLAQETDAVAMAVLDPHRPLVVSDIDDTVLVTGVKERLAMVRRTLLGDPTDRHVVPEMPDLLRRLARGEPVFYVSTSPWNLYQRLVDILDHHGVPAGPMLLTDWGFNRKQVFARPALEYKVETVGGLLDDFPGRSAVLVGDSGQHDLDAYLTVAQRYPGRIRAILIREVPGLVAREHGPDYARADALGVALCVGRPSALVATAAQRDLLD